MSMQPKIPRLKNLWTLALAIAAVHSACADVRLPALVGSGMVLQRDTRISLWGWADPGEKVSISFHGKQATALTDRNGAWSTLLGPFSAGGPYDLVVNGKNRLVLHDVLIGDVWLASGQSNMEFPVKASNWTTGVDNADRELAGAHFPRVRLFHVEHNTAPAPVDDVTSKAGWRAVTPETVTDFSAVAYFFGRGLHQRYQVPIGMIESNWGGTVAQAWTSGESLKHLPEFEEVLNSVRGANNKAAIADFDRYKEEKAAWHKRHAAEDRGLVDGHAIWADPALDTSSWPTIVEPQKNPEEALKEFDGTVWFRKEIIIPEGQQGKSVQVHLTGINQTDMTYFNGEKVGATEDWTKSRDYAVPAELVRAGRNVIAIRIAGNYGYVGMFDAQNPDRMNVEVGGTTLPLAGKWSYQPGPDLSDLPAPPLLAKLNDPPKAATLLFNGMIHPLIRFQIRGVIWYQGESNAIDNQSALQYRKLFPTLIEDWRRCWGEEMPFLFVQLHGYGHNKPEPADYPWAELREAQSMALSLPHTGMATAVDISDENGGHPTNKEDVAQRLVLAAAKVAYGENVVYSGPTYQSMAVDGSRVRIKFSNLGTGLSIKDQYGYIRGFEIAAADGKYRWAQARQEGNDVLVFHDAIPHPVSVRYGWRNIPDGNVFNAEGLPAPPFRTDATRQAFSQPSAKTGVLETQPGTVHIQAFDLPVSPLSSPEAQDVQSKAGALGWDLNNATYVLTVACPIDRFADAAAQRACLVPLIARIRKQQAESIQPYVAKLRARHAVDIEKTRLGGVPVDIVVPTGGIPEAHRNKVLINVHGGAFIAGGGFGGLIESIPVADVGKYRVIAVDYRLAPESQFPAGSEDVEAVYRALLKEHAPEDIAIYGCSAGGMLTAQATAWLQKKMLPPPGAIAMLCAAADFWSAGDSGRLDAARFGIPLTAIDPHFNPYLTDVDPDDALAYPLRSSDILRRFPPSLLITSTRDLALSSVSATHEKLSALGVETELHVFEGLGHAFMGDDSLPESQQVYKILTRFFDRHLGHAPAPVHR